MLVLHTASRARKRRRPARIGLAVAGGGPIGGMYELGALRALEQAVEGLDLRALDVYVGISAGALLAAGLANRIGTAELCRIFISGDSDQARFRPDDFLRPAYAEYLRRAAALPRALFGWFGDVARHPFTLDTSDAWLRFGSLLPTGLFDNGAIRRFLAELFRSHGRSDDFRTLGRRLYVIATDLDSGEAVRFGAPGRDEVPISLAIEASAALPGLYPPVRIDGRHYVDGALRHTLHASVALEAGADLVLGVNPLVPIDTARAQASGKRAPSSLLDGGLPAVLSQTFRALLQSRARAGASRYPQRYAHADVALFEPSPDDVEMFFTNVFSFARRRRVAEHAYRSTLDDLRARREEIGALLARHGLRLREEILDAPPRSLLDEVRQPTGRTRTTRRLDGVLDELRDRLSSRSARARPAPRPRRRAAAKT
ncbi:patatin-like phospholipase family protein [Dokdonella sp.]|uniref:patatin-like phospholipase family protein n=1 Tax=Dokdonella sp. TaxID=2291710 RepID=UPI001B13AB17|nr:patatin-like phospholipase family protein [Dokdonella sp.]MBO9663955.1 patatin-like phospholipase family protein [Dokdonella sp.]